jgi:hypothetical protein
VGHLRGREGKEGREGGKGRREGKEGRAARRVVGESVREISETVRLRFEFICDATMSHLLIG